MHVLVLLFSTKVFFISYFVVDFYNLAKRYNFCFTYLRG